VVVIVVLAGLVIVAAGMRAAASVLVPVFTASFLAILLTPSVQWLMDRKVPKGVAVVAAVLGTVVAAFILALLVGDSLVEFSRQLPTYMSSMQGLKNQVFDWLTQFGVGSALQGSVIDSALNTSGLLSLTGEILSAVAGLASNGFVILLLATFALLEIDRSREVVQRALGPESTLSDKLQGYTTQVVQYVKVKTLMSFGTGVGVALLLWLLGVDYPLLWGSLAFLLNFVPNVGSIIAFIPPVILALLQYGLGRAVAAAVAIVFVNSVFSNIIEPKMMGRSFGMAPWVVFVALLFWAWVFGPVGMILAIPLTVALKIALESSGTTEWIAALMG
jgi:predicted PurR-regulated permease PerM